MEKEEVVKTMSPSAIVRNFAGLKFYAEATRNELRTAQKTLESTQQLILDQNEVIRNLQQQVAILQARTLGGRATT